MRDLHLSHVTVNFTSCTRHGRWQFLGIYTLPRLVDNIELSLARQRPLHTRTSCFNWTYNLRNYSVVLLFLYRYPNSFQYTFNYFQWHKRCPSLPLITRRRENLFKSPLHSVSCAPWYPIFSFDTSFGLIIPSFYGGKSLLCLFVCRSEFQEVYAGSKPASSCYYGKNFPRFIEVLFCELKFVLVILVSQLEASCKHLD